MPGGRFLPSSVERRIHGVYIPLVKLIHRKPQPLAEALIVDDLSFAQEADDVVHIRVVAQTEDIVIGDARLLLCCNHIRTTCD